VIHFFFFTGRKEMNKSTIARMLKGEQIQETHKRKIKISDGANG
jgi:hypothetical protein